MIWGDVLYGLSVLKEWYPYCVTITCFSVMYTVFAHNPALPDSEIAGDHERTYCACVKFFIENRWKLNKKSLHGDKIHLTRMHGHSPAHAWSFSISIRLSQNLKHMEVSISHSKNVYRLVKFLCVLKGTINMVKTHMNINTNKKIAKF